MAKQLDISKGEFTTDSGKTYKLATSLTMGRYIKFDELEKRMYFNRNASEMFADIRKVYDHLDKNEQNEPRIILHNMMSAIKDDASKKYPTSFLLCTLFLYEDGEDLNTWSEDDANRKVADWIASGYEAADFFAWRQLLSELHRRLEESTRFAFKSDKGSRKRKRSRRLNDIIEEGRRYWQSLLIDIAEIREGVTYTELLAMDVLDFFALLDKIRMDAEKQKNITDGRKR